MKYIIVGSGPCGLSLAYTLVQNGHHVELIERDEMLGGSWNSQWIEDKYWSENAPRVIPKHLFTTSHFMDFLNEIGMYDADFSHVYGNLPTTITMLSGFFMNHLSPSDMIQLTIAIGRYTLFDSDKTLQEWLDTTTISKKGKKAIKIFSILINAHPRDTHVNDFFAGFTSIPPPNFLQFREPNKWHQLVESKIKNKAQIFKNTEVIRINSNESRITDIITTNKKNGEVKIHKGDRYILAIPPPALITLVSNCNVWVKNNWNGFDWLKDWCERTYYVGFGFQLHFRENNKELPKDWCWSCHGDWNVIIEPVSDWLHKKSKDQLVNSVWSCCITDMDAISKHTGKSPNQSSKDEIIAECLRQINANFENDTIKPFKITQSDGLYRKHDKWMSKNVGFTRSNAGYLKMRGKIDNLFCLGCQTQPDHPGVAVAASAVEASVTFLKEYHPETKKAFYFNGNNKRIALMCFLIVCFYMRYKKQI
tara:strand:- start:75 stop:1508 length:1434 start_codon:yes stop_codon:yes gene_type:complete